MKKNVKIRSTNRKKNIFQFCVTVLVATVLFTGSVTAQVAETNPEIQKVKIKIVKVFENGEVTVSEKIIDNANGEMNDLLKKLDDGNENENSSKVVKKKIVVLKTTGEEGLSADNLFEESGFDFKSCNLPPHCKNYLKKHCKDFDKCPKDSTKNCCKKILQNCDTAKCKIIECYAMCMEKCGTGKKSKIQSSKESEENLPALSFERFEIFPNPNNGNINLNFSLKEKQPVLISIKDIAGKMVFKQKIKDFEGEYNVQINLGNVNPGIYFLNIEQKKQIVTKKFVVE